jgi:2-polyprenyl-6-methoxyphenol hydroxylase-like FAD-dependent oxidoreductase
MSENAVVAGASVAGLASACALVERGWRVTVLERRRDLSGAGRAILLQPNGLAALARLGALRLVRDRGHAISRVAFYDRRHWRVAAWDYGTLRHPHPCAIEIRPAELRRALAERLAELGGEVPRLDCEFLGLERGADAAVVGAKYDDTGREAVLDAALVIGADGPDSAVRGSMGIRCRRLPVRDLYLLGTVDVDGRGDELAVHLGPGYGDGVVPLGDGTYFWDRVTEENRRAVETRDLAQWRNVYARRLPPGSALPEAVTSWSQLTTVEVRPFWAMSQVADGAVLAGDAAGVVHPHSAQGANLALEDAVALGDALAGDSGPRPLTAEALAAYGRPRLRRRRRFVLQSVLAAAVMDAPNPFWRLVRMMNLLSSRTVTGQRVALRLGAT